MHRLDRKDTDSEVAGARVQMCRVRSVCKHSRARLRADSRSGAKLSSSSAVGQTQNWLKKGHTSEGIHDELFPESLGDGVWGPSYGHQRTGCPAEQPL
jgi:hypothetical protein